MYVAYLNFIPPRTFLIGGLYKLNMYEN